MRSRRRRWGGRNRVGRRMRERERRKDEGRGRGGGGGEGVVETNG